MLRQMVASGQSSRSVLETRFRLSRSAVSTSRPFNSRPRKPYRFKCLSHPRCKRKNNIGDRAV
jgi:hypothetical protein